MSWIGNVGSDPLPFQRLMTNDDPDLLRGYRDFRWRGRGMVALSAEYRWPLWVHFRPDGPGLDLYLLAEIGQVYNDIDEITGDNLTFSYGAGVRLIGSRDFVARVEYIVSRPLAVALVWSAVVAGAYGAGPSLADVPIVWHEDDRRDIPKPEPRDVGLIREVMDEAFWHPLDRLFNPARAARRIVGNPKTHPAANVNQLDEVPNSSWFTNRIGLFPMSPAAAARGPAQGIGPKRPWIIISAKTEGVSPGFNIRDARGDIYLIKFDAPGYLGMASAAGVISGRILHAVGYNVPEDYVATFRREELVLGPGVEFVPPLGPRRLMTEADVDVILHQVGQLSGGEWRALASKFLSGAPIGPFSWKGRRGDDPNDRVNHEDRRELRGMRMFAAWLCHFDLKQGNTLDMYVTDGNRRFLRHHFIDFASTLGSGANGSFEMACFEHGADFPAMGGRALSFGLHEDAWRKIRRPDGLDEVGFFESDLFDPIEFKPLTNNAAFANMSDRDGYWAAKIISAFTDRHLEAVVAEGKYRNPAAAEYVARTLGERRDKIARYWFERMAPLDFFVLEGALIRFHDLGVERGVFPGPARYRVRATATRSDRDHESWTEWSEFVDPEIPLDRLVQDSVVQAARRDVFPFFAVEVEVNRGSGWSSPVMVFLARSSGRIVAVEH
jgi:hypothetical protein